ncbi:MAG: hypothetical protein NWE94_00925 [Candidatus Bathyarchaeota archaeon]|nr:hypothetical protein [Candidatus Bathyarchaeota archaeon]
MKELAGQVQDLSGVSSTESAPKMKCVLMAIYEKDGKTVLQPLVAEQEAKAIPDLFQNKTLEIWLSNGKEEITQFDIAILKYNQVLQALKKCRKVPNQVCLKNHFENIVSCEQCPLSGDTGEGSDDDS